MVISDVLCCPVCFCVLKLHIRDFKAESKTCSFKSFTLLAGKRLGLSQLARGDNSQ